MNGDDLLALAGKYRIMGELRAAGAPDERPEERARLRALAERFPGALRELDTLSTDEIERRRSTLESADAASPSPSPSPSIEPWMEWMHWYHAIMRVALQLKRGRAVDADSLAALSRTT